MRRESRAVQKGERGQSFTELAISLVFLLILLTVIIELAWAFYTMIALRDTAQEAASFGAICPDPSDSFLKIKTRLRDSTTSPLDPKNLPDENIEVKFFDPTGTTEQTSATRGDMVHIKVTYWHDIVVPFAASFLGTTRYPLTVEVSDIVLVDKCKTP